MTRSIDDKLEAIAREMTIAPDDARPLGVRLAERLDEEMLVDILRQGAERRFEMMRVRFDSGDLSALMEAISECTVARIPLPHWTARAFNEAYGKVARFEARSWDDVFGKPFAGKKIDNAKDDHVRRFAIYRRVLDEQKNGRAIGAELFEEVGTAEGMGRTRAERLYYEAHGIVSTYVAEAEKHRNTSTKE